MNRHHLLWLGGGTSAVLTAFAVLMLPQPPVDTDCSGPLTAAAIAEQRQLTPTMVSDLQTKRSLTLADLCAIPDDKLQRAIARVHQPKPDHPGEACAFARCNGRMSRARSARTDWQTRMLLCSS